jgi:hypothetical protein
MLRASPRNAMRSPTRRQPLRRGSARSHDRASHRSARRYDGVCHLHQHHRGDTQGSPWPPCPGRQGSQRLAADESSHDSANELPPATSHGYAEWDFSGVPDPVMFRRFLDATDYWFGYSDDSNTGRESDAS